MDRKIKALILKLKRDARDEQLRLKKEMFDLDYEYFLVSKEALAEKLTKLDTLDAKKSMLDERLRRIKNFGAEYANAEKQFCIYCYVEGNQLVSLGEAILQSKLKRSAVCRKCGNGFSAPICAASTAKK
jgi:hypothetical protein